MSTSTSTTKITPNDIEAKLRSFQGTIQDKVEEKKSNALLIAGLVSLALVAAFYMLGRRSGTRRSALVEIRRV